VRCLRAEDAGVNVQATRSQGASVRRVRRALISRRMAQLAARSVSQDSLTLPGIQKHIRMLFKGVFHIRNVGHVAFDLL
jgi:hypothetical protein